MRCVYPQDIYERLDELDPSTFETDAAKLLHGLGFDRKMMAKGTKDMSGAHCSLVVASSTLPRGCRLPRAAQELNCRHGIVRPCKAAASALAHHTC